MLADQSPMQTQGGDALAQSQQAAGRPQIGLWSQPAPGGMAAPGGMPPPMAAPPMQPYGGGMGVMGGGDDGRMGGGWLSGLMRNPQFAQRIQQMFGNRLNAWGGGQQRSQMPQFPGQPAPQMPQGAPGGLPQAPGQVQPQGMQLGAPPPSIPQAPGNAAAGQALDNQQPTPSGVLHVSGR